MSRPIPLHLCLLLCCLLTAGLCFGQGKKDSLLAIVNGGAADSVKVKTYIELAKIYRGEQPALAYKYSLTALDLATKSNYGPGIALANKWAGFYYYDRSVLDTATVYWEKSLQSYIALNDFDGMSNMYNNLGSISFNFGNSAKALDYFMEALNAGEKSGNAIRVITSNNNVGLIYMSKPGTYEQALVYLKKSLEEAKKINDADNIGAAHTNIGEVYMNMGKDSLAMFNFLEAKKILEPNGSALPYIYLSLGRLYQKMKNYSQALNWFELSANTAEKVENTFYLSDAAFGAAETYRLMGDQQKALEYFDRSRRLAEEAHTAQQIKMSYKGLANTYADLKDYRQAYFNLSLYSRLADSMNLLSLDSTIKKAELGLKDKDIALLTADQALKEQTIQRAKLVRNAILVGLGLVLTLIGILYRDYRNKIKTNKLLDQRKAEIENLLLNILPYEVASELQKEGHATPRFYDSVSVMFTDFVSFSKIAESMSPQQIVSELNEFFTEMDEIIDKYGLEKIKTIGDSFMCAGGIPTANNTHPVDMVRAGLDIVEYLRQKNKLREQAGMAKWEIRIGINTGSIVAGVVGKKKYAYDIWGNTVNIASRMESNGEPGMLNISADTYALIKDRFDCTHRGKIYAKNVGEIDMYFVDREKPASKQAFLGKAEKSFVANDDMIQDKDVKVSRGLSDL